MLVALTGASGHIGGNLVRALLEAGHKVRALARTDTRAIDGLDVEVVPGDVLDLDSLLQAFVGADVVHHLAGRISITGDPDGMVERINVEGVDNVIRACADANVGRLVHYGTLHSYDPDPPGEIIDETRALARHGHGTAYDITKAQGQQRVLAAAADGLDAVVAVPAAVLGPHDHKPSRAGEMLLDLARGTMPALVDGGFNWVDARDVALGGMAAADRGRRGEAYFLCGRWASLAELAGLVHQARPEVRCPPVAPMSLARVWAPVSSAFAQLRGGRPRFTSEALLALRGHRKVSHKKAAIDLGYTPRPLEDTVRDSLVWFTQAGLLAHPGG
jgi:dihydroflavonol-4-reductase